LALLRALAFWGLWRILPYVTDVLTRRAKPRLSSTVAGRRTYTEEELQAALRDIQSGKLGTRRAAVIYGIPRSTLRNKVRHFFSNYALLNFLVDKQDFFCKYCSYFSISNFKMTPILITQVAYFY
jgi:helix-turn-helix, Psq domain